MEKTINQIKAAAAAVFGLLSGCRLVQQTRRIDEIDTIIQRLHENMVSGALTRDCFAKLSAAYEQEQKELEASTTELRESVEACETQTLNVKDFLKLARSYTEPERLTPEILRMFVDKIVVHEGGCLNGHRVQQVDIYYRVVRWMDMSVELVKNHGVLLRKEIILHSDQGCHYTCVKFIRLLKDSALRQIASCSMIRTLSLSPGRPKRPCSRWWSA